MTLREKLSLPAPQWLLFGLVLLLVIGITKLVVWIAPLLAAAVVEAVMWFAPIAWQATLAVAALICAMFALAWRLRKQRKLYEDVMSGSTIIFEAEYTIS